jgi:hypothetical protein
MQLNYWYVAPVLEVEIPIMNVRKCHSPGRFKEQKHCAVRSTNSFILFRERNKCLKSAKYRFAKTGISRYIITINFIQNFIQSPSLKVKSIYIDEITGDHLCGV